MVQRKLVTVSISVDPNRLHVWSLSDDEYRREVTMWYRLQPNRAARMRRNVRSRVERHLQFSFKIENS